MQSNASVRKIDPGVSVPKIGPSASVPKIAPRIQVKLSGCFRWKLVFNYDITGAITKTYRHKIVERVDWDTFQHRVKESHENTIRTTGLNGGGFYFLRSATVDDEYDEVNHFLYTLVKRKADFNREAVSDTEWKYEIGRNSKMSLYQLYFIGPGIALAFDAHSSSMGLDEVVDIRVNLEARKFVSGIKVVYGNSPLEKPHDCLKHSDNTDPDLNIDSASKYIWLVPEYTMVVNDACTSFEVIAGSIGDLEDIDDVCIIKYDDLNSCYLALVKDVRNASKVVRVGLSESRELSGTDCFNKISEDLSVRLYFSAHLVYETFVIGDL
ncbi:hypothetical protein BDD12DRAFT_910899 [Trichophaea hybrida]|nr:hypothetical protein BDD12DRAFT_910899 [Trichophaea hybrida]